MDFIDVVGPDHRDEIADRPSPDAQEHQDDEHVEEEDECRVCRGPAEEGQPLFAPCKCSGSIGYIHQSCLMSWLEVTRGDGRCELCKTKFKFDPQYAENTPDKLPAHEVILGLSSRLVARWLPFAARVVVAASLWLVVAPLVTSYLYHGWMHRPSYIASRWKWDLVGTDTVSGAIVGGIVIISFLSLVSFADFLRLHWQEPRRHRDGEDDARNQNEQDQEDVQDENQRIDEAIVEAVGPMLQQNDHVVPVEDDENSQHMIMVENVDGDEYDDDHANDYDEDVYGDGEPDMDDRVATMFEAILRYDDEDDDDHSANSYLQQDVEGDQDEDPAMIILDDHPEVNDRARVLDVGQMPADFGVPQQLEPMDPVLQDDEVDMEINVALDELLGLRGPVNTLLRNLMWLLAFNATYLGIFMFLPRTIGSIVYSGIFNTTACSKVVRSIPFVYSADNQTTTMLSIISAVNVESEKLETAFRLPDLSVVVLGYLSVSAMFVSARYLWHISRGIQKKMSRPSAAATDAQDATLRQPHERNDHADNANPLPRNPEDDALPAAGEAIGMFLDATASIVKVGILLFLKMFFLPLILGLCLDGATMPLFGHSLQDRTSYAARDLFSFVLLHWVGGITFMLLVTVFLLQLREVMHPALLARVIRPQEPRPDLLGNLMNEPVGTHVRRMLMSLAIYAPLLILHVGLPVKLIVSTGFVDTFSFFKLNFWHIVMPQIQIPLELIMFHLSMLALLERYKNSIGDLQHICLKRMCTYLGILDHVLPKTIGQFKYIGSRSIFLADSKDGATNDPQQNDNQPLIVDPFWYYLSTLKDTNDDMDPVLADYISTGLKTGEKFDAGETDTDGHRTLDKGVRFIRLPVYPASGNDRTHLLPTSIGRYRLKRNELEDTPYMIEIWEEDSGVEIVRPPEGWDDLGAGGAFVQERWAWGKERKSFIEGGVAKRTSFRTLGEKYLPFKFVARLALIYVLSWALVTCFVLMMLCSPLAVGRSVFYLFRVPHQYIHDPMAFCIGGCIFFPTARMLYRAVYETETPVRPADHISSWFSRVSLPPTKKLLVATKSALLWWVLSPLIFGTSYDIILVKSVSWYSGEEELVTPRSVFTCWITGMIMLHVWAFLMYFGVFTWAFWTHLGNGLFEPPDEDELGRIRPHNQNGRGNNQNINNEGDETNGASWQGKNGAIARFFKCWGPILMRWEWDVVNQDDMLEGFAVPVATQITTVFVGSSSSFLILLYIAGAILPFNAGLITVPIVGEMKLGLFRMLAFRTCAVLHTIIQLGMSFQDSIYSWLQVAHKVARDDRYLIGEVLMEYVPEAAAS